MMRLPFRQPRRFAVLETMDNSRLVPITSPYYWDDVRHLIEREDMDEMKRRCMNGDGRIMLVHEGTLVVTTSCLSGELAFVKSYRSRWSPGPQFSGVTLGDYLEEVGPPTPRIPPHHYV